jgi:hypothetical protein
MASDTKTLTPKLVEIGQIVQALKKVDTKSYTHARARTHNPAFDHTRTLQLYKIF